jgi:hypothetical protein
MIADFSVLVHFDGFAEVPCRKSVGLNVLLVADSLIPDHESKFSRKSHAAVECG